MEIEKKFDELGRAHEEFKKAHQEELKELKEAGEVSKLTAEKVDRINDEISNLQSEVKEMKTAAERTGYAGEEGEQKSEYAKHFNSFLRKGMTIEEALHERECKEHSVMIDEDGGFLVDSQMSNEIVTKVFDSSPMRQLASVQTISSDRLEMLEDLDEIESGWVGEKQARPETETAKFKKIAIPVHELYAQPAATQKILDDAAVNVESWLAGKAAEKFSRDEATAFVRGDGVNMPKGFLSYADGTGFGQIERVETAASNTLAADDLIELSYKLKGAYKTGASWLMQRETVKLLRKFKGSDGQYLWQPGLNGDAQDSFLGFAINEADDMDAMTGTDGGKESIAFGNWRAGYQIVDRTGVRVLRDPYTRKPFVLFYFTKRVGGGVKNFEAIKSLKIKA